MEENNSKEINLLQLLQLFFNWIKTTVQHLFKFIGFTIQLLYRHLILTAIIVFLCLSFGIYLSRPEARIYKAEALAMIYGSDAQTVREISKQLENSDPGIKTTSLINKLELPDSVVKNIVGFHSYYVIQYLKDGIAVTVDYADNYSQKDTMYVKMRDRVYMRILTKKPNQVPLIEKAVLKYFNANELLKTHFDNAKNQLTQQIRISKLELARVDSLAKVNYFKENNQQLRFNKNSLVVGEQQKQLFYNDLLRLQDIISSAQSGLENFKQPVEIPSNFVVNPLPINGMFKYIISCFVFALIISIIIAGFIENSKNIGNFLKDKSKRNLGEK